MIIALPLLLLAACTESSAPAESPAKSPVGQATAPVLPEGIKLIDESAGDDSGISSALVQKTVCVYMYRHQWNTLFLVMPGSTRFCNS